MEKEKFDLRKRMFESYTYRTHKYRHYSNELNIDDDNFVDEVIDTDTRYYKIIENVYEYKLRQIMDERNGELNNDIIFFFKYIDLFNDPDDYFLGYWDNEERRDLIYYKRYYRHCADCDCERCKIEYDVFLNDDDHNSPCWIRHVDKNSNVCYFKNKDCDCVRCIVKLNINSRFAKIHRKYYYTCTSDLEKKGCKCIGDDSCDACRYDFLSCVRKYDRYQMYIYRMFKIFISCCNI